MTSCDLRRIVAGSADSAKVAVKDAQASHEQGEPVGYVAKARDLAAQGLGTASSYVTTLLY